MKSWRLIAARGVLALALALVATGAGAQDLQAVPRGLDVADARATVGGQGRPAEEDQGSRQPGDEPRREDALDHYCRPTANSIGSTDTLACAIFSRNLGRRPVGLSVPM